MRDFELYIEDDRYNTPTLLFIHVSDEQRALEVAEQKLRECERHRGVEVREKGARLFGLGSLAAESD